MNYRVGIVGAGQLARMMAQAAIPLGIEITLLAASSNDGAARVSPRVIVGDPGDPDRIRKLAEQVDVVTFDHELVDPDLLDSLAAAGHSVFPRPDTMRLAHNKRRQREQLSADGFPMPAWRTVNSMEDIHLFEMLYGRPVVLKAVRGGYDGRGVWMVETPEEFERVYRDACNKGAELLVEEFLELDGEVAVLVVGSTVGDFKTYPATETVQRNGICHELHVPARFSSDIIRRAERIALQIAESIDLVGVMAVEFFVVGDKVLVNELAPRPHNSGHWTIEGATTSQFEQHLRAVLGWPLGSTALLHPAVVTRNLLGPDDGSDPFERIPGALGSGDAHLHWYGKESRPGRKIGHVTSYGPTHDEADTTAGRAWSVLAGREVEAPA
ncbi:MAG: 5-(carboxyamino)imidazole ribonucleotide synthase [Chloroflexota bacterium]|nr:5-(carboxyamino)imidazole ribonucleotide synthase [Chloroflexota bacterium]